jgi:hypothetical protein
VSLGRSTDKPCSRRLKRWAAGGESRWLPPTGGRHDPALIAGRDITGLSAFT